MIIIYKSPRNGSTDRNRQSTKNTQQEQKQMQLGYMHIKKNKNTT